jgi:hypothetical protein
VISTDHLDAYLDAMESVTSPRQRFIWPMMSSFAIQSFRRPSKVRIRWPMSEPHSLGTIDAFDPKMLLRDNADFVAVFTIKLGDHKIDGMDHMHLNEAGVVDSMTVT